MEGKKSSIRHSDSTKHLSSPTISSQRNLFTKPYRSGPDTTLFELCTSFMMEALVECHNKNPQRISPKPNHFLTLQAYLSRVNRWNPETYNRPSSPSKSTTVSSLPPFPKSTSNQHHIHNLLTAPQHHNKIRSHKLTSTICTIQNSHYVDQSCGRPIRLFNSHQQLPLLHFYAESEGRKAFKWRGMKIKQSRTKVSPTFICLQRS